MIQGEGSTHGALSTCHLTGKCCEMRPQSTELNLLRTVEHKQFVIPDASAAALTFIAQYYSLGTATSAPHEVQLFLTEFMMLVSSLL